MSLFLAFLGVSFIVIATPGPDTAITIRNTLLGGRAGGVSTALGIASGQTIWALATSAGIVALLVASEPLFLAVICWCCLSRLSRRQGTAGSAAALPPGGGAGHRQAFAAVEGGKCLSPRPDQRSWQSKNGRVLRQSFAPVRAAGPGKLRGVAWSRIGLRRHDLYLAGALRDGRRQGGRFPASAIDPPRHRGCDRHAADRSRHSHRDRTPLVGVYFTRATYALDRAARLRLFSEAVVGAQDLTGLRASDFKFQPGVHSHHGLPG